MGITDESCGTTIFVSEVSSKLKIRYRKGERGPVKKTKATEKEKEQKKIEQLGEGGRK